MVCCSLFFFVGQFCWKVFCIICLNGLGGIVCFVCIDGVGVVCIRCVRIFCICCREVGLVSRVLNSVGGSCVRLFGFVVVVVMMWVCGCCLCMCVVSVMLFRLGMLRLVMSILVGCVCYCVSVFRLLWVSCGEVQFSVCNCCCIKVRFIQLFLIISMLSLVVILMSFVIGCGFIVVGWLVSVCSYLCWLKVLICCQLGVRLVCMVMLGQISMVGMDWCCVQVMKFFM